MSGKHHLKTWPGPFQAILDGRKRHEIRKADRDFQTGDTLVLQEWDPKFPPQPYVGSVPGAYTGRSVRVRVTYLTAPGQWGLPADLCVMSVEKLEEADNG